MPKYTSNLKRGEICVDGSENLFLIVSIDSFNSSEMKDVIALRVDPLDFESDADALFVVADSGKYLICCDEVATVPKSDLESCSISVSSASLAKVEDNLRYLISPKVDHRSGQSVPATYPAKGEVLHAQLDQPKGEAKPIVAISTTEYGEQVDFVFTIVCRVTSVTHYNREFDIRLTSRRNKVVCSHIQTVHRDNLEFRSRFLPKVTEPEAEEIRKCVWKLLGI